MLAFFDLYLYYIIMAILTTPSIQTGVYNRLPFLQKTTTNNTLIDQYTVESLMYFKEPLGLDDTEYLDTDNYPVCIQALIPDVVAIYMLNREALKNMGGQAQGNGGNSVDAQQTVIKRAKAGEAEVEFMQLKASDGGAITTNFESIIKRLQNSAISKAYSCGYTLTFGEGCEICLCKIDSGLTQVVVMPLDPCE